MEVICKKPHHQQAIKDLRLEERRQRTLLPPSGLLGFPAELNPGTQIIEQQVRIATEICCIKLGWFRSLTKENVEKFMSK